SYQLAISVACLVAVVAASLLLSRGVLRAVADLTEGFLRFGRGDFHRPIRVERHDELGGLAEQANQMAASLARLVREREQAEDALKIANRELEAFSYSVAHDLRAPLRGINGFSRALLEDYGGKLDGQGKDYLERIAAAAQLMGQLIDAMLLLSRVTRAELLRERVDLSRIADAILRQLKQGQPDRAVDCEVQPGVWAHGDPSLLRAVLENLLGNAWKFTARREDARISFGVETRGHKRVFAVRDNGAGFDMTHVGKLFNVFTRLHSAKDFDGTGIGLATVLRVVRRHGGKIWAEGEVGKGAAFFFTLEAKT
ncbi:MAG TPA: ATP-binding protein, partial [Magnetospirillaceae bacterium]|nr:ATP-binding protein [Magnetospirillaceae bacterium]